MVWDEDNLAMNLAERPEGGYMKIDEPDTPFEYTMKPISDSGTTTHPKLLPTTRIFQYMLVLTGGLDLRRAEEDTEEELDDEPMHGEGVGPGGGMPGAFGEADFAAAFAAKRHTVVQGVDDMEEDQPEPEQASPAHPPTSM